ncbi:hypothetical protein BY996DRAFT_6411726 [Phakopsora pachyrhizi]|nr:hypothetical protein BY996DRAFT_6411726 [Phakopsora pachyrhizi]
MQILNAYIFGALLNFFFWSQLCFGQVVYNPNTLRFENVNPYGYPYNNNNGPYRYPNVPQYPSGYNPTGVRVSNTGVAVATNNGRTQQQLYNQNGVRISTNGIAVGNNGRLFGRNLVPGYKVEQNNLSA